MKMFCVRSDNEFHNGLPHVKVILKRISWKVIYCWSSYLIKYSQMYDESFYISDFWPEIWPIEV